MTISVFTARILIALSVGMLIGFERQWNHKTAGLRTTTLVAVGSALYVLLSISVTQFNGDATRIIGQVVTGVGFLCAGVIFKEGFDVHGLTTAVIIWCSSAVGCLAAAGLFAQTFIATALILTINIALKPVDKWLANRNQTKIKKDEKSEKQN